MFGSVDEVVDPLLIQLEQILERLDPEALGREESVDLFEKFHRIERLGAAGKALCSRRVCDSGAWKDTFSQSTVHFMAETTKSSVRHSYNLLESAYLLKDLPETDQALRQGKMTERQAVEMASAAAVDPSSETHLVEMAQTEAWSEFQKECARVRSAALDEEERQRRAHKNRGLTHWVDADGAFRLSGRFTTADGGAILAGLAPFQRKVAKRDAEEQVGKRRKRKRDPLPAQWADALVEMAHNSSSGSGSDETGPRATVHVRVDHSALVRGHTEPGEICEIPGAGPIPVGVAHSLMSNSFLAAVFTQGQDILSVAHLGRNIPARLMTALLERDQCCRVPGCGRDENLEIDHMVPIHQGGTTSYWNLVRLCRWHHYLKTYWGYSIHRRGGRYLWDGSNAPPDRLTYQPRLSVAR